MINQHLTPRPALTLSLIAAACLLQACATNTQKTVTAQTAAVTSVARTVATPLIPSGTSTVAVTGSSELADALAKAHLEPQIVRRASRPWIGGSTVTINNDDKLPASFYLTRQFFANKRNAENISLAQWAARVTELTQVPIRITADVYSGATTQAASPAQPAQPAFIPPVNPQALPPGNIQNVPPRPVMQAAPAITGPAVTPQDASFDGSLLTHLDHVTNKHGLAWIYEDGAVVVSRLVTSSYEIETLPGKTTYNLKSGRTSSGTSNTGSQQNSTTNDTLSFDGSLDGLGTIESTVAKMINGIPGSSISRSDGSGLLVVTTSKEMQAKVRNFIAAENKTLAKRVQIQFDVYSVITDVDNQRGIDWNILYRTIAGGTPNIAISTPTAGVDTTAGAISASVVKNNRFKDSNAVLRLLHEFGESARHTPVSLVTQNRQWIEDGQLQNERYVSETTPGTAVSGSSATSIGFKTDSLTTGDLYQALAYVTNTGRVILRYSLSFSNLVRLQDFTSGANGEQRVQLPKTDNATSKRQVTLNSGEIMVVTGLSRFVSTRNTRTLGESLPVATGGSENLTIKREHFAVFIRAVPLD